MANSGVARQATAAIAAVAGGVIGAGLFAWLGPSDASSVTRPASSDTEVARPSQIASHRPRLEAIRASALEARVQALEAAQAEEEPAREPDYESLEPPSQREVEAQHEARIHAHRSEDVDPAWARETSAAFSADFERSEGTHFHVADVECRSTSCSVVVEWPSREVALAEWRRALMQPTRANCGRSIVVPEQPEGASGAIRATLLYDCSTWVAEGSNLLPVDQLPAISPG